MPAHVLTATIARLHDDPDQVMHRPEVDAVLRERADELNAIALQWIATL